MKMKSRIPNNKIMETYMSIAKEIVDPSTKFVAKNVDGKTRIIAEKAEKGDAGHGNHGHEKS